MILPEQWLAKTAALHPCEGLTPWFGGDTQPARVGYYERKFVDGIHRQFWDGRRWRAGEGGAAHWRQVGDYPAWRGLRASGEVGK